jgi:glucosyl-3-phosphoglycerate synthase
VTLAAQRWLHDRTWRLDGDEAARLAAARAATGLTVSVVVPALNEESRVGRVVAHVAALRSRRLVDELVVVDGGSTDATVDEASAAGADVVRLHDVLPPPQAWGKGGALWASLQATHGDVVVFLDADVETFDAAWVPALVAPLLDGPDVQLVKAAYARPLRPDGVTVSGTGGRVTELVARPLLHLLWPDLSGVLQPLAGECAARRTLLEELPFASGYGVEIGLLVDTYERHGLTALAQVELGEKRHRHQDDEAVARMAASVLHTALRRLEAHGRAEFAVPLGQHLRQAATGLATSGTRLHDIATTDLPPLDVAARRSRGAARA